MPKKNLPPFVQVIRAPNDPANPKPAKERAIVGYRGWAMIGKRRKFGPRRKTAEQASADAARMRGPGASTVSFGGTIGQRAKEWLAEVAGVRTPDTVQFYRSCMKRVYRSIPETVPVERLSGAMLTVFLKEAQRAGLGARSIQHCRRALTALLKWCRRRGYVRENPCGDIPWPKPVNTQPDVFNEVELAGVLLRIIDPWARDIVSFLAHTGLRRAELARLTVADVDVAAGVLWVLGKTAAVSHPIPAEVLDVAERLLAAAKGEHVVRGSTDRARRNVISETFRTWQKKLKEPRLHPHALRHSVATILLRKGERERTVQEFLRHSSPAMTKRYMTLVAEDVRRATSKLRIVPPKAESEGAQG